MRQVLGDAFRMRMECQGKKHGRLPVSVWLLIQGTPPCFFCVLDRFFTPDDARDLTCNTVAVRGPGPPPRLETLHLDGNALTGCLPPAWQNRFTVTTRTNGEPQNLPYCPD